MRIGCHCEDSDESEDEESGADRTYAEILRLRLSERSIGPNIVSDSAGRRVRMADRMTGSEGLAMTQRRAIFEANRVKHCSRRL